MKKRKSKTLKVIGIIVAVFVLILNKAFLKVVEKALLH